MATEELGSVRKDVDSVPFFDHTADLTPEKSIEKHAGRGEISLVGRLATAEAGQRFAAQERRRLDQTSRALLAAVSAHQKALRSLKTAQARAAELQSGRGAQLFKYAGVKVYEFWLELPGYSGPVRGATASLQQNGDVHQVSDVTGTTKSGLGGALVGGLLLGPIGAAAGLAAKRKNVVTTTIRTVDTRQFELEVRGPGFAWSTIQGPDAAAQLRKLRDFINARGSTSDDIADVISSHAQVLVEKSGSAEQLDSVFQSASTATTLRRQAFHSAINQYRVVRLPFLLHVKARWARSSLLHRSIIAILSPIILVTWLVQHGIDLVRFRKRPVG